MAKEGDTKRVFRGYAIEGKSNDRFTVAGFLTRELLNRMYNEIPGDMGPLPKNAFRVDRTNDYILSYFVNVVGLVDGLSKFGYWIASPRESKLAVKASKQFRDKQWHLGIYYYGPDFQAKCLSKKNILSDFMRQRIAYPAVVPLKSLELVTEKNIAKGHTPYRFIQLRRGRLGDITKNDFFSSPKEKTQQEETFPSVGDMQNENGIEHSLHTFDGYSFSVGGMGTPIYNGMPMNSGRINLQNDHISAKNGVLKKENGIVKEKKHPLISSMLLKVNEKGEGNIHFQEDLIVGMEMGNILICKTVGIDDLILLS